MLEFSSVDSWLFRDSYTTQLAWPPVESHWDSGQGQEKLRWALQLAGPWKAQQGNVDGWKEESIEFLNTNPSGQMGNTNKQINTF